MLYQIIWKKILQLISRNITTYELGGFVTQGVLPYMGYTGMCRSTGYAFCLSDSGTGYKNHPGTGYLFLQCLSGTGSQIHLFPSGTGPESRVSGTQWHTPVLNFREYPPWGGGGGCKFIPHI